MNKKKTRVNFVAKTCAYWFRSCGPFFGNFKLNFVYLMCLPLFFHSTFSFFFFFLLIFCFIFFVLYFFFFFFTWEGVFFKTCVYVACTVAISWAFFALLIWKTKKQKYGIHSIGLIKKKKKKIENQKKNLKQQIRIKNSFKSRFESDGNCFWFAFWFYFHFFLRFQVFFLSKFKGSAFIFFFFLFRLWVSKQCWLASFSLVAFRFISFSFTFCLNLYGRGFFKWEFMKLLKRNMTFHLVL